MNKILISSERLFNLLSKIDFEEEQVLSVGLNHNQLIIYTDKQKITCYCVSDGDWLCNQQFRKWDKIKELLKTLPEQPIVLMGGELETQIKLSF